MARKGLGKGLGALLSEYEDIYENATQNNHSEQTFGDEPARVENLAKQVMRNVTSVIEEGSAVELPANQIDPNVNQPRKNFDQTAMNELAESIKTHGIIQPIIVVRNDKRYMIIAGERRWRAAKQIGLATVPAIVKSYTPQQIKEISLIENLQREDLNPIEAARAIRQLMDEYDFTQEQVADRIGKSRSSVANTLRLLNLSAQVIELIVKGRLSSGHAKCLVVVDDAAAQYKLAIAGCDNKINVREFEKLVSEFLNPKPVKPKPVQSLELKQLIADMSRVFATKVTALGNDKRGRIYIDYFTSDDLDRLFALIEQLKP